MFKGKLFKEQIPAAEFLVNRRRVLLAWEQGTGKTIISIAACEKLFELGKIKRVLILAPPGIAWQWRDKIEEFTTHRAQLTQAKEKDSRSYKPRAGISYFIVPYSVYRRDYNAILDTPWDVVIADEAQEFKNNTSKIYKLMLALNRATDPTYRWALTGTAIGNKLEELYRIFYWVDKKFLPKWPEFEKTHILRNHFGQIYKYQNLNSLSSHLPKRMSRKEMKDMGSDMPKLLPPRVHHIERSKEYAKAEKSLLNLLDDFAADLQFTEEGNIKGVVPTSKVAIAFHECRQALISTEKLKYAKKLNDEILEENPQNKHVIFCFYKRPLYDLYKTFGELSVKFTGDESADEKQHNIELFRNSSSASGPRVLLASNAGSAGLDLPFANYITNLDVPFSHTVLDQRYKRIVRANSVHSTAVANNLIMEDSLEEYYYQVVNNLGKLANSTYHGTNDEVVIKASTLRQFIKNG